MDAVVPLWSLRDKKYIRRRKEREEANVYRRDDICSTLLVLNTQVSIVIVAHQKRWYHTFWSSYGPLCSRIVNAHALVRCVYVSALMWVGVSVCKLMHPCMWSPNIFSRFLAFHVWLFTKSSVATENAWTLYPFTR